jgi:hypothetical protein
MIKKLIAVTSTKEEEEGGYLLAKYLWCCSVLISLLSVFFLNYFYFLFLAPAFVQVQSDFNAKVPVVRVKDSKTGLLALLGINSAKAILTSSLLKLYALADDRVRALADTFRNWAKVNC